jgi:peroxiredoxin
MAQLEPHRDEIERSGSLLYIAAEKRGGLFKPQKYLAEHPISFPFLLDEDRAVTKAYGVYHRLGKDAINIARPATFLVDRDGILRFVYVSSDQKDRTDINSVLLAFNEAAESRRN